MKHSFSAELILQDEFAFACIGTSQHTSVPAPDTLISISWPHKSHTYVSPTIAIPTSSLTDQTFLPQSTQRAQRLSSGRTSLLALRHFHSLSNSPARRVGVLQRTYPSDESASPDQRMNRSDSFSVQLASRASWRSLPYSLARASTQTPITRASCSTQPRSAR